MITRRTSIMTSLIYFPLDINLMWLFNTGQFFTILVTELYHSRTAPYSGTEHELCFSVPVIHDLCLNL